MSMRSVMFFGIGTLMVTSAVGCGEPFAATGSAGSGAGSSASSGGSTSSEGMGGGMSTSTSTSSSGGGKLCMLGDPKSCDADEYCMLDTTNGKSTCSKCYDFSHFSFGKPQKLVFTPPANTQNPVYPRIGENGELLFSYTVMNPLQNQDLGYAPLVSFLKWGNGQPESFPLTPTDGDESGPLYLPTGAAITGLVKEALVDTSKPVFLFHITTAANPTVEQIYALNPGGAKLDVLSLKGSRNYDIAATSQAGVTPRLWYVSNVNSSDEIVTLAPSMGGSPLSLSIDLDNGCPAVGVSQPWVTPTGNWMLFAARYSDAGCMPIANAPLHLFYIHLDPDGTPTGGAQAQGQPVWKGDQANRSTPAMSPDLCVLYFTETSGVASTLYSAVRQ